MIFCSFHHLFNNMRINTAEQKIKNEEHSAEKKIKNEEHSAEQRIKNMAWEESA